jgi:hypothetical protein
VECTVVRREPQLPPLEASVLGDRFRVFQRNRRTHPVSPVSNRVATAAHEAGLGRLTGRGQQRARPKPAMRPTDSFLYGCAMGQRAQPERRSDRNEVAAAARRRRVPRERKQGATPGGRCANLPMPGTHRAVAGGAHAQEAPTRPGLFVLPDSSSENATQHTNRDATHDPCGRRRCWYGVHERRYGD